MSGPRVHNGLEWLPVPAAAAVNTDVTPVEPILDGDGKIFVSIVSYRDGERCGATLLSLFNNAKDPENIVVGLFEQNAPEDKFCLEVYCSNFGVKTMRRVTMRKDVVKVVALSDEALNICPHYHQIRLIAYHHIQAKGPMLARSLVRKVLGNEEFCMQIDAHTEFASGWDVLALSEWKKTNNEFGVLSNVPTDKKALLLSNEDGTNSLTEVPRQCSIRFMDNGFPDYAKPVDGKVADLDVPLLGHGWSAAFSFAKCHLEESAPYDNFALYALPIEQFSRFARLWTRGYDVYTPTRNIVFHDYGLQPNGHGNNEWFKRQRDRFRIASVERVKTMLQMPGGVRDVNDQANLGIFGLGKRRTIEQLNVFTSLDLNRGRGNTGVHCLDHEWVPYDSSISPTENLFGNPDNLDPQPEYPLRTNLIYYHPSLTSQSLLLLDDYGDSDGQNLGNENLTSTGNNFPTGGVLFLLWLIGLVVWCMIFMTKTVATDKKYSRSADMRKKTTDIYKEV